MKRTLKDLSVKIFADGADKKGMLELNASPLIQGLTTDPNEQIAIVASLMEVAPDEARTAVLRLGRSREVEHVTVTGRIGAPRAVVVERRTSRFAVSPRRSMAR